MREALETFSSEKAEGRSNTINAREKVRNENGGNYAGEARTLKRQKYKDQIRVRNREIAIGVMMQRLHDHTR